MRYEFEIDQSVVDAFGMSRNSIMDMTAREFIDHAHDKSLVCSDVSVSDALNDLGKLKVVMKEQDHAATHNK